MTPPRTAIYTLSLHDALPIFARVKIRERTLRHDHAMLVRLEDVLDAHAEERGDAKRERQARVVLFVLERRSEEHTSELQSLRHLVCRLLLEKKNKNRHMNSKQ